MVTLSTSESSTPAPEPQYLEYRPGQLVPMTPFLVEMLAGQGSGVVTGMLRRFEHTTFHEAGHAVMSRLMGIGFDRIEVDPCYDYWFMGYTQHRSPAAVNPRRGKQLEAYVMTAYAGPIAESLLIRQCWQGLEGDPEDINYERELIKTMDVCAMVGPSPDVNPEDAWWPMEMAVVVKQVQRLIPDREERRCFLHWLFLRTRSLLSAPPNWAAVSALAGELRDRYIARPPEESFQGLTVYHEEAQPILHRAMQGSLTGLA